MPQLFGERAVFYMQRDAKYYTTLPYLLASAAAEVCWSLQIGLTKKNKLWPDYIKLNIFSSQTPMQVPITLIETLLYSTINYWLVGLNDADTGGRYGYWILMAFSMYMVSKI